VAASDATEEEKARLSETLADLRSQIKVLEAENKALKASLKMETDEKNQLIRQVNYWKKQATKGTK
jgi:cell shape-determining protein MreC